MKMDMANVLAFIAQGKNTIESLSQALGKPYTRSQFDTQVVGKRQRGVESILRRCRKQGLITYNRQTKSYAVAEGNKQAAE